MSRWAPNTEPATDPTTTSTTTTATELWPCHEIWKAPNPRHGNSIEITRTTWHPTAKQATEHATHLNHAWATGTHQPEPDAFDFLATAGDPTQPDRDRTEATTRIRGLRHDFTTALIIDLEETR